MAKKVIIIGSGPGGYPAALRLKELGAEVTMVEAWELGGTCLNRGCIPSKALLDAGHRVHAFEGLRKLLKDNSGANFSPSMLDWEKIKVRRAEVVTKLRTSLEKLFQAKKIEVLRGKAAFSGPKEITINGGQGEIIRNFDAAILAAGTRPSFPPPFRDYHAELTDSDRVFDLPRLPASMLIAGGGVIGLEFACFFNAIGVKVTVLELLPEILSGEDPQVIRAVRSSFEKRGVKFHLGRKTSAITIAAGIKTVELDDGTKLQAEEILVGAGRAADLTFMGLETIGLSWDRRGVKTDSGMRTALPNIYAVGDINGISLLAHSASRQGEIAADNIMGASREFDADIVPRCVYSWPEVGSVGLNKARAEAKGLNVKTARSFYLGIGKAVATDETEGFAQLVFNAEDDTVLGAQLVGGPATELIHLIALAVKLKLKRSDLREIIYAHPTMAEAIHEALEK
ncbi:MAG: dihydrolipoyl dehydrogenase [Elusimicrobia bacterium CG_4_10_14_0_2_um_filter_56_8]|nr:MAG: dihydrolipoyl dehydrogenase [Elusimicrobia bacterium CG1_02_56_21]PJA12101.1 MAG: dihydrolipoyl dehydrogenase [Elusimicrobia bacterium CG_4_10_14_0_2_um_filter_56_8]